MRQFSLLIIDDDPVMTDQLAELFRLEGYAVATAIDGLDALRLLAAGAQPDLLLLDMHMQGVGGEELVAELRAQGRPPPILVITADPDPAGCAQRIGARAYFAKPFDLPVLLDRVEQLLWDREAPPPHALA